MIIKGTENCNQCQAKCPFAAGIVLKSMEDHGFKTSSTTAIKQIYKNSKTFLISREGFQRTDLKGRISKDRFKGKDFKGQI